MVDFLYYCHARYLQESDLAKMKYYCHIRLQLPNLIRGLAVYELL